MASDTQADLFLQIPSWLTCNFQWGWFPLRLCCCCSSLVRAFPLFSCSGKGEAVCGAEARAGPAAGARSRGTAAAVPEHSPGEDEADQGKRCPLSLGRGCQPGRGAAGRSAMNTVPALSYWIRKARLSLRLLKGQHRVANTFCTLCYFISLK